MKRSHLRTQAWLLRGISSIPGALRLAGGRLSFTAFGAGNLWPSQLRTLERDTGRIGLAKRLGKEENTVVFDVPLADIQHVRFPWYYFSGGLKLTLNGIVYRFGFDRPSNTKLSGEGADLVGEVSRARRSGKAWKAVLIDASSASSTGLFLVFL